jgi:hypothetical protein
MRTETVITVWEPYRRWWGGMRADVTIETRTYHEESPGMYIHYLVAKSTIKVPFGWKYREALLKTDGIPREV